MYMVRLKENSAKDRAIRLADDTAAWLQSQVLAAAVPVQLLAALVGARLPYYAVARDVFLTVAPVLLQQAPYSSSQVVQLQPGGVIAEVVPLTGNEGLIGLDIFASSLAGNRDGALKAVEDHSMTLVGPMVPVQGGRSLVVRMPVFLSNLTVATNGTSAPGGGGGGEAAAPPPLNPNCGEPCAFDPKTGTMFWGFVSSAVGLDALLHAQVGAGPGASSGGAPGGGVSRLDSLEALGYRYRVEALGIASEELRVMAASSLPPKDPVEALAVLPNAEWSVQLSPAQGGGWRPSYIGGLVAAVVVAALVVAALLFAALVSRRRQLLLLESLVPRELLPELQAAPMASHRGAGRQRKTRELLGDLMEGRLPAISDLVLIRSALLGQKDMYTPLNVMGRINDTITDTDVAQSLMQQLGQQPGQGHSPPDTRENNCKGDDGGGHGGGLILTKTASYTSLQQHDMSTVAGAVAFILSAGASFPGPAAVGPAAARPSGAAGGGGGGGGDGGDGADGGSCAEQQQPSQQLKGASSFNSPSIGKKSSNKSLKGIASFILNMTTVAVISDGGPTLDGAAVTNDLTAAANCYRRHSIDPAMAISPPTRPVPRCSLMLENYRRPLGPPPSSPFPAPSPLVGIGPAAPSATIFGSDDKPLADGSRLPSAAGRPSSIGDSSSDVDDELDSRPTLPLRISRLPERPSTGSLRGAAVITPRPPMTLPQPPPPPPLSPAGAAAAVAPAVVCRPSLEAFACRPKTGPSPLIIGPAAPQQQEAAVAAARRPPPRRIASFMGLAGRLTGAAQGDGHPRGVAPSVVVPLIGAAAAADLAEPSEGEGPAVAAAAVAATVSIEAAGFPVCPPPQAAAATATASPAATADARPQTGSSPLDTAGDPAAAPPQQRFRRPPNRHASLVDFAGRLLRADRILRELSVGEAETVGAAPFAAYDYDDASMAAAEGSAGRAVLPLAPETIPEQRAASFRLPPTAAGEAEAVGQMTKRSQCITGLFSRLISSSGADVRSSAGAGAATGGAGAQDIAGGRRLSLALARPLRSRLRFTAMPNDASVTASVVRLSISGCAAGHPAAPRSSSQDDSVGASATAAPSKTFVPVDITEVERLLDAAHRGWQYDIWALQDATQGHALSVLGYHLIQRAGLISKFGLSAVRLARLLRRVEEGYLENPYHSAVHAADVLQTLHVILHGAQLNVHYLDPLGLLAAYLAAIVHDYAHPGLTGDFLIATSHPLALRYNDRSPLENHHCAAAFELLSAHTDLDVLAPLSATDRAALRKQVIELVLATDMKQHFSTLTHFNTVHRLQSSKGFQVPNSSKGGGGLIRSAPWGRLANVQFEIEGSDAVAAGPESAACAPQPLDDSERLLSLQVALKVADLGHLAEEMDVHKRWLSALEEEFFRQGDQERQLGLPISPLFDREKQGVSKSQVGFFEFVALPLANALVSVFPGAQPMMECLTTNYQHWRRVAREAAAATAGAAAAARASNTATGAAAAGESTAAAGGDGKSQSPPQPLSVAAAKAD